ncbi:Protein of unknown function [Bacillus cereus]|nr:Protein of unknown function [Bacillus cereus]
MYTVSIEITYPVKVSVFREAVLVWLGESSATVHPQANVRVVSKVMIFFFGIISFGLRIVRVFIIILECID